MGKTSTPQAEGLGSSLIASGFSSRFNFFQGLMFRSRVQEMALEKKTLTDSKKDGTSFHYRKQ